MYWFFSCADPESFVRGGPTLQHWQYFFRGGRIQIPLKAGQHRPASETPFNSLIALRIVRISGGPDPLSHSGSVHAFEHPTYIGGGVGGWGVSVIQKTLNPLHVHRLRKCLDAFHNEYRGRKQNLLVKRAWILGNWQTVLIQIRRRMVRRLIRVATVCST